MKNINNIFRLIMFLSCFLGNIISSFSQRVIQPSADNEVKVEITINKSQFSGFARLVEFVPEGSIIKYAKTEGGTFMIQDNKIKFIWLTLPKQDFIVATYTLGTAALKDGKHPLTGKFSYTEGEETKDFEIPASSFDVSQNQVTNSTTNNPKVEENGSLIKKAEIIEAKPSPTETKISTSNKVSKVTYSLQLLSTKDKLAKSYFAKNYKIEEPIKVETIDGINKYMLGEFKYEVEAIAYREVIIKKGCKDAFVVPFFNNKRISFEEAKKLESGSK